MTAEQYAELLNALERAGILVLLEKDPELQRDIFGLSDDIRRGKWVFIDHLEKKGLKISWNEKAEKWEVNNG